MFALFLTLITLTDLNRLIGAITDERTATHRKMIGADLQALISPLSDEWAALSARYTMLAEMSEAAYAELMRRESAEITRREQEETDLLTHVAMVCTACRKPVLQATSTGKWVHSKSADSATCMWLRGDDPVRAMVAVGNESVPRNA